LRQFVIGIVLALLLSSVVHAADDTYVKIQEMMNDLGGTPTAQKKNNGKTRKCASGGTKKITVTAGDSWTRYGGIYKNCREYGRIRDGESTITIGDAGYEDEDDDGEDDDSLE
jgi:hypothetical protein